VNEGSFAAIGLIDHSIQIWDLDQLEPMAPSQVLGEQKRKAKSKTKKKKKVPGNASGGVTAHDGAVLCLHGSKFNRSVLVSGSADHTVKVWDISEGACVHIYTHHEDKVQCGKWHPTEQAVLLSAAFDRRLALLDVRQPGQVAKVEIPAEAECAIWSRHKPFECIASADNGGVICYDVRKVANKAPPAEQVLWTLQSHDVACTAVADCPIPNIMVTAGLDGEAKVWNLTGGRPSMVLNKNLQAGPLFACQAEPDAQALMCFGGKFPVIWDLTSEQVLVDIFGLVTPAETKEAKEMDE
jgi:periodic tryptophan protein 1